VRFVERRSVIVVLQLRLILFSTVSKICTTGVSVSVSVKIGVSVGMPIPEYVYHGV